MQSNEPGCVVCSLASAFHASGDSFYADIVYSWLKESMALPLSVEQAGRKRQKKRQKMEHTDRLDFVVDKALRKPRRYHPKKHGIMVNNQPPVNTDVILCLLVDSSGGRSHAITLWNGWIFDSNLAYAIPLEIKSLDWCCADNGSRATFHFCHFAKTITFTKCNK